MHDKLGAHDAVGLGIATAFVAAGLPKAAQLRLEALNNRIEMRLLVRRSEEHTSELQSPVHLVCRLLLEKKNHAREHAASLARAGFFVMGAGGLALGVLIFTLAPLLMRFVLGKDFGPGVPVLSILALLASLIAWCYVFGIQWMLPLGLDRTFNKIILLAGLINIAFVSLLATMFGAVGMAWSVVSVFFFNDTATTEIYTLSLHDALPISAVVGAAAGASLNGSFEAGGVTGFGAAGAVAAGATAAGASLNGSFDAGGATGLGAAGDRKSTRLNSSHPSISYAVFCLKKKTKK